MFLLGSLLHDNVLSKWMPSSWRSVLVQTAGPKVSDALTQTTEGLTAPLIRPPTAAKTATPEAIPHNHEEPSNSSR